MDVSQTEGLSIAQAEFATGVGKSFEGWRLPTRDEVMVFMSHLMVGSNITSGTTNGVLTEEGHSLWESTIGYTSYYNGQYDYAYGIFIDDQQATYGGKYVKRTGVATKLSTGVPYFISNYERSDTVNYTSASHAPLLVNDGGVTYSSLNTTDMNLIGFSGSITGGQLEGTPEVSNVSGPMMLSALSLALMGFGARRKIL